MERGPRKQIGDWLRQRICVIARTSPADWGLHGFSTWSLAKLREHLLNEGLVAAISRETLRRILHEGGVSWLTTTTWKASPDPEFIPKMHRILDLYDHPPADGRVICVDEFGPLNLLTRPAISRRHAGPAGRPRLSSSSSKIRDRRTSCAGWAPVLTTLVSHARSSALSTTDGNDDLDTTRPHSRGKDSCC